MVKFWYETPLGQAALAEARAEAEAKAAKQASARKGSGPRMGSRMYAAAKISRLTSDWNPTDSSADSELVAGLKLLRSRCRQLVRDASYAKQARRIVVNNIIGTGIGMQAQVKTNGGDLIPRINTEVETVIAQAFEKENIHTGGRLCEPDMERMLIGQIFEVGDVVVREHLRPMGPAGIPYSLEVVEAERLADEFNSPHLPAQPGNEIRMGVEVDSEFMRPQAFWIRKRHPNEVRFGGSSNQFERVPADQVIHLGIVDRWPQTRGEPWMASVARRLNDMDGYSEAEIVRARDQAMTSGAIKTPEGSSASWGEEQEDGSTEVVRESGTWQRLRPGEELTGFSATAPNPQLDPFMRYMLREIAAGAGVSYESLSRDYSQSNYSSSKLSVLDDRDSWRCLQWWFIREFRTRVHRRVLQQAVLAKKFQTFTIEQYAANPAKFEAVRFKPRGWTWVDPPREVGAYKEAVMAGFTTNSEVIAATAGGLDAEDIAEQREQELKMFREKGLIFDTMPEVFAAPKAPPAASAAPSQEQLDAMDKEDAAANASTAKARVLPFR